MLLIVCHFKCMALLCSSFHSSDLTMWNVIQSHGTCDFFCRRCCCCCISHLPDSCCVPLPAWLSCNEWQVLLQRGLRAIDPLRRGLRAVCFCLLTLLVVELSLSCDFFFTLVSACVEWSLFFVCDHAHLDNNSHEQVRTKLDVLFSRAFDLLLTPSQLEIQIVHPAA